MVLYHIITSYQLLNVMEHRLIHHADDTAVLMIPDIIAEAFPQYEQLNTIFDKVLLFAIRPEIQKRVSMIQTVFNYFDPFFSDHGYKMQEFDTIYVAGAQYYFGIYLVENKIPFVYFEEGAGLLSRPEILEEIEQKISPIKGKYVCENGLTDGTNENITKRICNVFAQNDPEKYAYDETVEHFSTVDGLSLLSQANRDKIISFFTPVDTIQVKEDAVLILTQNFTNLRILTFEDQCLINQLLVDYFFQKDNILFKPHPNDILYYSLLFPESEVITDKFPSEFLPTLLSSKPRAVATISSTGIYNLASHFDDAIQFDTRFEKDFKMTHRYYTALKLLEALPSKSLNIYSIGANWLLLSNLKRYAGISLDRFTLQPECGLDQIPAESVTIIDDISGCEFLGQERIIEFLRATPQNAVVIFINSQSDYCFYDTAHIDIFENIVPVCIRKTLLGEGEDFYADLAEEVVYFYSKNEEYRDMAQKLKFEKELKYTQVGVSIDELTPEQTRIKVLEGILDATEKRLLYYINREKELTKELDELKK